jgi:aminoglycoside phosphotransferase (APT) family kinase protein
VIDVRRLAGWMDDQGLPGQGKPVEHRFVSGGTQNEIYEISRGGLHCAMRIPPPSAPADRDAGILREWRIIEALTGTGVPCPEAVARCADTSVLGRPFYLMGFVDGWSPTDQRGWPAPFDTDPRARQGIAYQMAEGIALLSRIDWRVKGLHDLGRPDGFHERQVGRWFRHGAPARLAAIVDWEMGTVGDPKLDLGWMLQSWPGDNGPAGTAFPHMDLTGLPPRSAVLARYAEVSGRQVDDIDYYLILARWKFAIVLEQGYQRAGDDVKLRAFGPVVLELMRGAAELAESTEYRS